MVDAFEREFAEYIGIKHCAAVSSGTAAMHLGLRQLFQSEDGRRENRQRAEAEVFVRIHFDVHR